MKLEDAKIEAALTIQRHLDNLREMQGKTSDPEVMRVQLRDAMEAAKIDLQALMEMVYADNARDNDQENRETS